MFANKILLILVAGFTKTTEQTFKQILLNNQKLSWFFVWTNGLKKLSSTLAAVSSQESESRPGTNAELPWQVKQVIPILKTLLFKVKTTEGVPKVLELWWTVLKIQ